ncbi:hybrid cluster protein-associated redox disulfide domain-containing protein [Lachnospiraceae bacterium RM5]|nr:hybrid cluster protein-associated redox disulfide domain-containing protein [Lachnospiraceae bacterium RM5]
MAKVDKTTIISDLLKIDEGITPILINSGMHCIGCPSSWGETLEEAAFVHGLDPDDLVNDINDYLQSIG